MIKFFRSTFALWAILLFVGVGLARSPQGAGVPSGSGNVGSCSTANAVAQYTASTSLGCGNADFTIDATAHVLKMGSSGIADFSSGVANSLRLPVVSGTGCPGAAAGAIQLNAGNSGQLTADGGTANCVFYAWAGANTAGATNCSTGMQLLQQISSAGGPTCASLSGASTLQKAETGTADASVLTFASFAAALTYRVCFDASVSSATSGVVGWTLSWTDSNGNAQTNIAQPLFQYGTAAPALTFTTSAVGNYGSCAVIDTNNSGANIVVKWVGGGTTAAKVSATVERMI